MKTRTDPIRHPYLPILIIGLLAVFSLSACESVEPWQRAKLAKKHMAWQPDPLTKSLDEHIYFSKEGSTGGDHAAGGGCGCN